jgi:hypothetical protein
MFLSSNEQFAPHYPSIKEEDRTNPRDMQRFYNKIWEYASTATSHVIPAQAARPFVNRQGPQPQVDFR